MQAAVEFRFWFCNFGQQTVFAEQLSHRDSAQSATETPEKFPTINESRISRTELNWKLLRGTNVGVGFHQSTNMNSDRLKMRRHKFSIPFFSANGINILNSFEVGG